MSRILGETPNDFEIETATRALENSKKQPFRDPQAQEISEHWLTQSPSVSKEQAEAIGMLWMTKILGASKETAEEFANGHVWSKEIGYRHAGVTPYTPNAQAFYKELNKVAPELIRESDLEWLIQNDPNGDGAWTIICHIDFVKPRSDFLTTMLVTNALIYK